MIRIIRNIFTSFALLFCALNMAQSQNYFEGKIVFESKYKVKVSNIDIRKLQNILGNGSVLFFREGSYYHKYDGGRFEFDLYNRVENKIYMKKRNNDTIYWMDCSKPGKKIQGFKLTPKKEKVLGIVCDQLKIQYEDHSSIHYYNSESIRIKSDWFKDFIRNGENLIDEKEKSIFIKSENEYDKYIIISTATKISRETVDEKIFQIPADAILVEKE